MDYFNFYFLKKLFSYKKTRKIIILICVFIFILLIKNNVFGFTYTFNNQTYTRPDPPVKYDYYVYYLVKNNSLSYHTLYYITMTKPIRLYQISNYTMGLRNSPDYYNYYFTRYYSTGSSWEETEQNNNVKTWFSSSWATSGYTWSILESNQVIYKYTSADYSSDGTSIYTPPEYFSEYPYFLNSEQDIALGGQDLIIMPGDFPNTKQFNFQLEENNPVDIGAGGIQDNWEVLFSLVLDNQSQFYDPVDSSGVGFYYKIPWYYLQNYLTLSKDYKYSLIYSVNGTTYTDVVQVVYGGNSPQDAIYNQINSQTQQINDLNNSINDLNDSTQELQNTITDSTIESSASDLPSVSVNDPSENGINNIFQSIYNAFCTGQAQNIVFPIPFTNKNITLSPYYVRDMLNNNGATWVYTLIQAFWGYLIGRYIVKDISKKITKIKGGNVENIENENIKEEML